MGPLFGMAGLAEAGEAFALLIGYGGLLLIGLTAAIGLFAYSRIAARIALVLAGFATLLFLPWEAFRTFESDDPDVHHWVSAWRGFACWWAVAAASAVAAAVRAFAFSVKPDAPAGPQCTPETPQGNKAAECESVPFRIRVGWVIAFCLGLLLVLLLAASGNWPR